MEQRDVIPLPNPDDDSPWTWSEALIECERLLLGEMHELSPADVSAGYARGHELDLAACRQASNRLAAFEARVVELRREALQQIADEVDAIWPGNGIGQAMRADDVGLLIEW